MIGNSVKNIMVVTLWVLVMMWLGLRLFDEIRYRTSKKTTIARMAPDAMGSDIEQEWQLSRREFRQAMNDLYEFLDKKFADRDAEYKVQEDND